ncbi:uncharacterized protein LOC119597691 [Penaeus monodon]|uniref:uncharacterized protein LOC119597691 n=1 Tax=Penaeus monodon TaxID=6687 RepID=UPI0018A79DBB|nr:uncharacterized protein LOC119597691 [Penaeus monodon]
MLCPVASPHIRMICSPAMAIRLLLVLGLSCAVRLCDYRSVQCATIWRCISRENICDGIINCEDESDENICSGNMLKVYPTTTTTITTTTTTTTTTPAPTPPPPNNVEESEALGQKFARTFNDTLHHPRCPKLYTSVGNKCLSLLYFVKVGWGEARALCSAIGGELVLYPSASDGEFAALLKYLREIGMTTDFWVGGRYTKDTEAWTWLDDAPMDLGSPYWAVRHTDSCSSRQQEPAQDGKPEDVAYWTNTSACYHYEQAPRRDSHELCAAVTFRHYFYISDEDCLSVRSPLCEHVPSTAHDLTLAGDP